jgi:hypothetical protein
LICQPLSDFAEEQAEEEEEEEGEGGMEEGVGLGGPMLSSKMADLVHHSLGRAPRGVCVPEGSMEESDKESDEMGGGGGGGSFWGQRARARKAAAAAATATRELGERMAITGEDDLLRPEGSLHASLQQQQQQGARAAVVNEPRQGTCPGCPHEVDVSDPEVVAAANAGVELMKGRGDLGSAAESNALRMGVILSATSQVVSGIRYKIVLSVVRAGGGGRGGGEGVWEVDVVSQPWMTPKYTLVGAKKVPMMEGGGGN